MFLKVLDPVYQSWAQNTRSTLFQRNRILHLENELFSY